MLLVASDLWMRQKQSRTNRPPCACQHIGSAGSDVQRALMDDLHSLREDGILHQEARTRKRISGSPLGRRFQEPRQQAWREARPKFADRAGQWHPNRPPVCRHKQKCPSIFLIKPPRYVRLSKPKDGSCFSDVILPIGRRGEDGERIVTVVST
jgi:hypothetical protein